MPTINELTAEYLENKAKLEKRFKARREEAESTRDAALAKIPGAAGPLRTHADAIEAAGRRHMTAVDVAAETLRSARQAAWDASNDAHLASLNRFRQERDAATEKWAAARNEATRAYDANRKAANALPLVERAEALLQMSPTYAAAMDSARSAYQGDTDEARKTYKDAHDDAHRAEFGAEAANLSRFEDQMRVAKEDRDRAVAVADRSLVTDLMPDPEASKAMTRYQEECSAIEADYTADEEALTKKFREDVQHASNR